MRNRFSGICYRCFEVVDKGDGHFEKYKGKWLVQHYFCAIKYRGLPKLPFAVPKAKDKVPYQGEIL